MAKNKRGSVYAKQTESRRRKEESQKLAGKKQTAKRVARQERLEQKEEMDRRRNKRDSVIILCVCGILALIIANHDRITLLFS